MSKRASEPLGTHREAEERGSASIWAAAAIAAIFVLIGLIVGLGSAAVTRHRAASAADLAALAAAAHAVSGEEAACARARWVADRMLVALTTCRLRGWEAEVEITARPPDLLLGMGLATARARAGPVGTTAGAETVVHRRAAVVSPRRAVHPTLSGAIHRPVNARATFGPSFLGPSFAVPQRPVVDCKFRPGHQMSLSQMWAPRRCSMS